MRTRLSLLAALAVAAALLPPSYAHADPSLLGFPANQVDTELRNEQVINASPQAATALDDERGLAAHVHRMGQYWDYRTAVYMRDRLAAAGWQARIVTYVVPIAWPTEQHLQIVSPYFREIDLYEPALPGDPWSADHAAVGKPYSGYATDGDVTGPLVYVHHGMPSDYAALARLHVKVRGAIALADYGGGWGSRRKATYAARLGVQAMLAYPEPFVDDYDPRTHGTPYPRGPFRPIGAALRNEMMVDDDSGDPTVDGVPLPGAKHKSMALVHSVSIPYMNVTPLVGQQLLELLGGPLAPPSWHTNVMTRRFHVGGPQRARFVLKSRRFFGPIWDVDARLPGAVRPKQFVVIGSHRDAWTYGAIDPGSGSTDLLLVGDALGKLYRQGWRPYRTVVIGSWDGEELNYFGSDAWVRQHETQLLNGAVAYINTDEVTTGKQFLPYATDEFTTLVRSASEVAIAPNGKTLYDYWGAQDKKRLVTAPGTGSDHEVFAYHEGIPSIGYIYNGVFGTWHSAYDNIASLKVFDPGMRLAQAEARITGITALRLASAPYAGLSQVDLVAGLQRRLNSFANQRGDEARRIAVVRALEPYVNALADRARLQQAQVQAADQANDVAALDALQAAAIKERAAYYLHGGTVADHWQRSLLYNSDDNIAELGTLELTLDRKKGESALNQLVGVLRAAAQQ